MTSEPRGHNFVLKSVKFTNFLTNLHLYSLNIEHTKLVYSIDDPGKVVNFITYATRVLLRVRHGFICECESVIAMRLKCIFISSNFQIVK